jgi:hypothetical protein
MTAHYLLAVRYLYFNKCFACVQCLVVTVGIIEKSIIAGGNDVEDTYIYVVLLSFNSGLALMSLCQRWLAVTILF